MATPAVAPLETPFVLPPPTITGGADGVPIGPEELLGAVGVAGVPTPDEPVLATGPVVTVPEPSVERPGEVARCDGEEDSAADNKAATLDDGSGVNMFVLPWYGKKVLEL